MLIQVWNWYILIYIVINMYIALQFKKPTFSSFFLFFYLFFRKYNQMNINRILLYKNNKGGFGIFVFFLNRIIIRRITLDYYIEIQRLLRFFFFHSIV